MPLPFLASRRKAGEKTLFRCYFRCFCTYVVEFKTAARARRWRSSIPRTETAVIRHFQERMPYVVRSSLGVLAGSWQRPHASTQVARDANIVSDFAVRFHAADEMPYVLASMLLTTLALNLRPTWES
jgi:hypothetical protein